MEVEISELNKKLRKWLQKPLTLLILENIEVIPTYPITNNSHKQLTK